jgi:hypothetical protein
MKQPILIEIFIVIAGVAAIGGAVFAGLASSTEIRGDTAVKQVLGDSGAQEIVPDAATPAPNPVAEYLLQLDAEDYTTYIHPVYGFSFSYPRDFDLLTASWRDEEIVDVAPPDPGHRFNPASHRHLHSGVHLLMGWISMEMRMQGSSMHAVILANPVV